MIKMLLLLKMILQRIDSGIAGDIKIFYTTIDSDKVYYLLNTSNTMDEINTYQEVGLMVQFLYGWIYIWWYRYDENIAIKESMYKNIINLLQIYSYEEIPAETITESTSDEFIMDGN